IGAVGLTRSGWSRVGWSSALEGILLSWWLRRYDGASCIVACWIVLGDEARGRSDPAHFGRTGIRRTVVIALPDEAGRAPAVPRRATRTSTDAMRVTSGKSAMGRIEADRNLLFGILTSQMGFSSPYERV